MKAWAKRMIWFFGINILILLNDLIDLIRHFQVSEEAQIVAAVVWVLTLIIPLILMKDDLN